MNNPSVPCNAKQLRELLPDVRMLSEKTERRAATQALLVTSCIAVGRVHCSRFPIARTGREFSAKCFRQAKRRGSNGA